MAEALLGGFEAVLRPVQLLLGRGEGQFGLTERRAPVGRPFPKERSKFGPLPHGLRGTKGARITRYTGGRWVTVTDFIKPKP